MIGNGRFYEDKEDCIYRDETQTDVAELYAMFD